MRMRLGTKSKIMSIGCVGILALVIGCTTEPGAPPLEEGNIALGITKFVTQESTATTTVLGLDASGTEVGRLEIVHGRFTVSPSFADDFDTSVIDGRKLHAAVGAQEMFWETLGYEPVLELPAPPSQHRRLAEFLADPQVKSVLSTWQIGFQPSVALDTALGAEEAPYDWIPVSSMPGSSPTDCSVTSCGTVNGKNINMCNGSSAYDGARVTQSWGYTDGYSVGQCCPVGSGGFWKDWWGVKVCPFSGNTTPCGTKGTNAACKGCPEHLVESYSCSVWLGTNSYNYQYYLCENQDPYSFVCEDW